MAPRHYLRRVDQVTFALPRPGSVTKALIGLLAFGGIAGGILWHWIDGGDSILARLIVTPGSVLVRPWTLWTATFVPAPTGGIGFIFSALFAYFLATDLEKRWGSARLVRFLLIASAASFGFSLLMDVVLPGGVAAAPDAGGLVAYHATYNAQSSGIVGLHWLHPDMMFGSSALLAAISAAWARENATAQIRLFLILPITGRIFFWITFGFCVIGLIYPNAIPEGPASPFGGFFAGLLLSGSPSPLRAVYLRLKLMVLRGRGSTVKVDLNDPPKARKPRSGPPLRVVTGGQSEDVSKRPPKDKRYLN